MSQKKSFIDIITYKSAVTEEELTFYYFGILAFVAFNTKNFLNKFDTNKDTSNRCENERIYLNFLEFT